VAHTVDTDSVLEFASEMETGGEGGSKNVFAMQEFEREREEEEEMGMAIHVRSETKVEFSNV
jgi:hypothetical protein